MYYGRVGWQFGQLIATGQNVRLPSPAQLADAQAGVGGFLSPTLSFTEMLSSFQNGVWRGWTVSQVRKLF